MEQEPGKMMSVVLDRETHQMFTNAWRNEIKYGKMGTGRATKEM